MKAAARDDLREILDQVRAREDLKARRVADPVNFVHGFRAREDQEIVALIAAVCAFGNVKAIRSKVADLLERAAEVHVSPAKAGDEPEKLHRALRGWKHRLFRGEDLASMIIGARALQRAHTTLGRAFAHELAVADSVHPAHHEAFREALAAFCDRIRTAGGLPLPGEKSKDGRRGQAHLLPDARAGSAAKRLFLFLRWMIRPADGIDLGLWADDVSASRLFMPLDVHIHKLARNVGLTKRRDLSWKTAVEVTKGLAAFDPNDPTRYDFSLCHLGMVQRCPSKRDEARCEGCGVKPVCIRWRKRDETGKTNRGGKPRASMRR